MPKKVIIVGSGNAALSAGIGALLASICLGYSRFLQKNLNKFNI